MPGMTEGKQMPFFVELAKLHEDTLPALATLERIAEAVFGPIPTGPQEAQGISSEIDGALSRARAINQRCHDLARKFSALIGNGIAEGLPQPEPLVGYATRH